MSALRNLSPLGKLSLFVVLLLVVAVFTTISFSLRQQKLISKALSVSESAKSPLLPSPTSIPTSTRSGEVDLVAGDINHDNVVNILDYNLFLRKMKTSIGK